MLIWTFLKGYTFIIGSSVFFKRIFQVVISLINVLVYTFPCEPCLEIKCLYIYYWNRSCVPSKWLFMSSRFPCISLAPSSCNSNIHQFAYYGWVEAITPDTLYDKLSRWPWCIHTICSCQSFFIELKILSNQRNELLYTIK